MKPTFLSLFSGIGGLDLGLERAGWECVAQVEIDPFCRLVLAKHWPDVPKFEDVRTVTRDQLPERIDLIAGGFPCQDVSTAGRRAGIDAPRSGLWFQFHRLIREIRPLLVLVENTTGLLDRGFDRVLGTLAEIRFDAEWFVLSACAFGAPHPRERVFVVAYPEGERPGQLRRLECPEQSTPTRHVHWAENEPACERVVDGIPLRLERLVSLGNSVSPIVAEWIGRRLIDCGPWCGRGHSRGLLTISPLETRHLGAGQDSPDKDEVTSSNLVGPIAVNPLKSHGNEPKSPNGAVAAHSTKSPETIPNARLTRCGKECGRRHTDLPVDLHDRISVVRGCWEWTGAKWTTGYGYITQDGKKRRIHKLSYEWFNGAVPEGLVLDHLCRNVCCLNPSHLEAVPVFENNRRGLAAKINLDVAVEIVRLHYSGYSYGRLAQMCGLSKWAVADLCKGRTWKEALELVKDETGLCLTESDRRHKKHEKGKVIPHPKYEHPWERWIVRDTPKGGTR